MLLKREADLPANTVAVRCHDVARRRRQVLVTLLNAGRVAVTVPPGEVAVFELDQAARLREVLRAAVIEGAAAAYAEEREAVAPFKATVRCADAMDRDRAMTITSDDRGRVAVGAPAGGVAVFRPLELGRLRAALRAAIRAAQQQPAPEPAARPNSPAPVPSQQPAHEPAPAPELVTA